MSARVRVTPSIEPTPRACGIDRKRARDDSADLHRVLSRIQQDIRDRIANLARRAKNLQVIAIAQHAPATARDPVHGSREPSTERLHAAREISRARRFDDEVNVIRLERVVNDTESRSVAEFAEGALELADETGGAERGNVAADSQGDVAGMARGERGSGCVRVAAEQAGLAAGAGATASPSRCGGERERDLSRAASHRGHHHTSV